MEEPKFKRPIGGLYPLMYHTFLSKDIGGESQAEYYIQDLTENNFDEAVELLVKYLWPEETLNKAANISEKEDVIVVMKQVYRQVMSEKLSLACFKMGTNEMVSVNVMYVKTKGEKYESKVSYLIE